MIEFFLLMWKPLAACFILTGIHVYLGVHVVERKVIFVDLALAQIAALGAAIALLFGYELHESITYWCSLTTAFIGAVVFSMTRTRKEIVPHEAMIGIVYAVSAALAILILSRHAEGDEEIRHMLVGNILLITNQEMIQMLVLYGCVGLLHWRFRKTFILISTNPEDAFRRNVPIKWWDLLFYLLFGLVVTSSVQIAGVLLVFSFLIVPAVAATLLSASFKNRLILGWLIGALSSFLGIVLSFYFDLPTGAAIVCAFGGILLLILMFNSTFQRLS